MLMHTDLISKDDLWLKFLEYAINMELSGAARDTYRHCANIVAAFPVKQEYCEAWWTKEGLYYECANCEQQFSETSNYCPNCGAKMVSIEE